MNDQNETFIQSFKQMWGNYPELALLLDKNHVVVAVNKVAADLGIHSGINCFSLNKTDRMCQHCKAPLMRQESKAQRLVNYNDAGGVMDAYWIPVEGSDGFYVHFGNNITEWADPGRFPQIKQFTKPEMSCS